MPSVRLALVLQLDSRRILLPVCNHELLVDAAATMLREQVDMARREGDPDRAEEAVILSRILRRLIPEIRELLDPIPPATLDKVVVQ